MLGQSGAAPPALDWEPEPVCVLLEVDATALLVAANATPMVDSAATTQTSMMMME